MIRAGVLLAAGAIVLAACGGGDDAGATGEAAVRRDVERAIEILWGDEDGLGEYVEYVATECRDGLNLDAFVVARRQWSRLLGAAKVGVEVTNVEFLDDDRALVSARLLVDGEPSLLFGEDEAPALWVRQGDRWRVAENCAFYGTELSGGGG